MFVQRVILAKTDREDPANASKSRKVRILLDAFFFFGIFLTKSRFIAKEKGQTAGYVDAARQYCS
jgi:hypothetical protein